MKEATFQKKLLQLLKEIPRSKFFVKEAAAIRGISDIIGCVNGRAVYLEVKRDQKESLKKTGRIVLQRYFLEQMRMVGAVAEFVYPENHQEILEILRTL